MPRDWLELLREEAAVTSVTAAAARLGYSRPAISLALSGKYPGKTDKLAARVLEVLGSSHCPHLGRPVSAQECAGNSGTMPTSSPAALRLWRACQGCPHKPETDRRPA